MKEWRDFNLSLIHEVFEEVFHQKDPANKKKIFYRFMDLMMKESGIEVPCLTCGILYPLNALEHECLPEDIWINNYVKNASTSRFNYKLHAHALRKRYPLKNEFQYIYRGKNFETKSAYESFLNSLSNGYITIDTVSSWTTEYDYAVKFSRFMQIGGTSANESVRKKEIYNMLSENANITGYKGIVLCHQVRKEDVLCDISEENIAGLCEHEIILLPGRYDVGIVKIIDREPGTVRWNINKKDLHIAGL